MTLVDDTGLLPTSSRDDGNSNRQLCCGECEICHIACISDHIEDKSWWSAGHTGFAPGVKLDVIPRARYSSSAIADNTSTRTIQYQLLTLDAACLLFVKWVYLHWLAIDIAVMKAIYLLIKLPPMPIPCYTLLHHLRFLKTSEHPTHESCMHLHNV